MYTLKNLRSELDEYRDAAECFRKSSSGKDFHLEIESIQKITNQELSYKFQRKEQEYREKYGLVRIHLLFHGTRKSNIPSILEKNLEVARHGQNIGHRFGNGVSFSALSNYASHYCDRRGDVKQMLLCRVLISNIIEVPESRGGYYNSELPFIEGRWPPIRYDTTAKTRVRKDVIVKYEDHTYCPKYLINFKKIHVQAIPMRVPVVENNYPQRATMYAPIRGHERAKLPLENNMYLQRNNETTHTPKGNVFCFVLILMVVLMSLWLEHHVKSIKSRF